MRSAKFGVLGEVSRLTLGGGGIGQIWGETSKEEALATLHAALDGGIDLIDCAPLYANCERFVGEAFVGAPPSHVRFTTKCFLGTPPKGEAVERLETSLNASLDAMRLPRIDIFFLHSNICADDYVYARGADQQDQFATRWSAYAEEIVPAMEALTRDGRIGAWGITGSGVPDAIIRALKHEPKPRFVQAVTNLLDSAGSLRRYAESAKPRAIIRAANEAGVPVLGIRAVQAGALTASIDRTLSPNNPDTKDYERAAPFRALCAQWGEDPAYVAHRYALSMEGPATIILGVKNRAELAQCLKAETDGPYSPEEMAAIDGLGLRAA
ncbi:MAG: aldo/keto reductase [Hyphomonadaceae bacterium]